MFHLTLPASSTVWHDKKQSLQDRRETAPPQKYKNVKCFSLSIIDKDFIKRYIKVPFLCTRYIKERTGEKVTWIFYLVP